MNNEQALQIEQILNKFVVEQFSKSKEDQSENNNSFLFLEKNSLNLLLAYLMFMKKNTDTPTFENKEVETSKLVAQLDTIIEENKQEFEALLDLFKSIE